MATTLTQKQIFELRCLGYHPKQTSLSLEDVLHILPAEINGDGFHSNLAMTAPDTWQQMKWVCGYRSDNIRRKLHYYCEADTPLEAAFSLLKRFIAEFGTELLNQQDNVNSDNK